MPPGTTYHWRICARDEQEQPPRTVCSADQTFTTSQSTSGPGGPILVVASPSDPFSRYYAEILRAEGLNEFEVATGPRHLGDAHRQGGGDPRLAGAHRRSGHAPRELGAGRRQPDRDAARQAAGRPARAHRRRRHAHQPVPAGWTPRRAVGSGHRRADAAVPRHGRPLHAERGGARSRGCTRAPARRPPTPPSRFATWGPSGGQAAAFTFDLARSVVYTRQGNPAWAGQKRDGTPNGIRPDDLFYGAKAGDVQPDWVDMTKIDVPQADEQQRLLANLITRMNLDRSPLPRFWYLPRGEKAAVVMTGDDHAQNGTPAYFNRFKTTSAPGCSVADWECVRATSYLYAATPHERRPGRRLPGRRLRARAPRAHLMPGLHAGVARERPSATSWPTSRTPGRACATPPRTAPIAWSGATGPASRGSSARTASASTPPTTTSGRPAG